jgi:diguanylate cyclase (GGDEF)-like protein/PAS domain S-box-containing protein
LIQKCFLIKQVRFVGENMLNSTKRSIPVYIWFICIGIFSLSLIIEFYIPITTIGFYWFLNLIPFYLLFYYLGIYAGIISFILLTGIRFAIDYEIFLTATLDVIIYYLIFHLICFITVRLLGKLANRLKKNETNLQEILNNTDLTYWSRDLITGTTTISQGHAKIWGLTTEDLERNPFIWYDRVHPEDKHIIEEGLNKQNNGQKTKLVYRIMLPDGDIRWVEDRWNPYVNEKGEVVRVDGVINDITTQKKAQEQLNKLVYMDSLTGLPNRSWFQIFLTSTIQSAKRTNRKIAILFIDFDNFKRVNDTLGHHVGDDLLRQMANRLQSSVRKGDIVSRQGGDEFLVLMDNTTPQNVTDIAERILIETNKPFQIKGNEIFSTPSIGISMFPESGDTADELIEKADFAMYLAKERGKNNYQFYNAELNEKMKRKINIESLLHKAIEKGELALYYQPQINLKDVQLAGAEALLRWNSELGLISPDEFIPIAEETGLIIPLGEWVFREACRHAKLFRSRELKFFPISVNISTKQLMNTQFIDRLKAIMEEEGVTPNTLTLEITESTLLFYDKAQDNIDKLRQLGVGISIDDFGVGFSSLSMIKNIMIDELKIDRSFIKNALENKRDRSILEGIIQIGKNIDAKVVVEGVETVEQLEYLMDKNVYGQGYFFSQPLCVSDFIKWYYSFYKAEKRE